jgi:hypothetical protein
MTENANSNGFVTIKWGENLKQNIGYKMDTVVENV